MASSEARDPPEGSCSSPKDLVAALARESGEWRQQQAATSEHLRIISISPGNAQRVLEAIAKSAASLCQARFCQVFRFDGALIQFAAHHGLSPQAVADIRRAYPMPPGRASAVTRAILSGSVEEIADVHADPEYTRSRFASLMRFRSVAAVPILEESVPVGAIGIARSETGYFPRRQIELLKTFAEQAAVAIQNARLFDDIRDKTRQLEIASK